MRSMRTLLASIGVVGLVVGMGYGMWAVISPGEERKREILKVWLPGGSWRSLIQWARRQE